MESLQVKAEIDLDEVLPEFGFTKAREYFHCGNVSVRIYDRIVCISHEAPAARNPRSYRIALPKVLLTLINKGVIE